MPGSGSTSTDAVLRRMIAERERRIESLQARVGSGHGNGGSAAVLDRLVHELVWDDGPRALRAVLPLARLIRRLGTLSVRMGSRIF